MQTLFPALRNLCQTYAIWSGGRNAIFILQGTPLVTVLGGAAGYHLAANTYVSLLVTPEERTGSFGRLQGVALMGTGLGYVLAVYTGDGFGTLAPFNVTFVLLLLSSLISGIFLRYIVPLGSSSSKSTDPAKDGGLFSFLLPLRLFSPRVIEKEDGGNGKGSGG